MADQTLIEPLSGMFAREAGSLDAWIAVRLEGRTVPFYSSADIRDAGFKAACVDLNLFPAGFNNLCDTFAARAIEPIRAALGRRFGSASFRRVLLVPEAHTRNTFYNSNLHRLRALLAKAGLDVAVAAMAEEGALPSSELITYEGERIEVVPVRREGRLLLDPAGSAYDWILLNNDLSSGPLSWLEGLDQPVFPPPCLGWHKRSKYQFFVFYNAVVRELAETYSFDPWLLSPATDIVTNVSFETDAGRGRVAAAVSAMLDSVAGKYTQYGITDTPHVFVKNDAGTYGIGIMVARSADDIITMNRKDRNKMAVGKGRKPINAVVIQEAIPTRMLTAASAAEPVVYLIGREVIGAFLRANPERGTVDNLNAKGMTFYRYCDLQPTREPVECVCRDSRQAFYSLIAKLAVIAAAREHEVVCNGAPMPG